MNKHRPGEQWLYPVVHFHNLTEADANGTHKLRGLVIDALRTAGAEVPGWSQAPLTPAERKAIAAAPEMLAALVELLDAADSMLYDSCAPGGCNLTIHVEARAAIAAARTAIAKATGTEST